MSEEVQTYGCFTLIGAAILGVIGLGLGGFPQFGVYQSTLAGKGRLMEAESSRQIATLEAKAKLESSKALAMAEVERAKGVAEANKIIGDSLKGNDAYLRYLWIDSLHSDTPQVIYVPTEAGLPILEAKREAVTKN